MRSNQSILKEINPDIFIERTAAETEAPMLWAPDAKNWLIGKDPDAGKGWKQKEKAVAKDKMVGWHHWFNGHEFEQTLGDGEGQWSLACCSPWGHSQTLLSNRTTTMSNSHSENKAVSSRLTLRACLQICTEPTFPGLSSCPSWPRGTPLLGVLRGGGKYLTSSHHMIIS